MDCWIASFPRSGNTYFRNILYFVYGIESSTWHNETSYPVDKDYNLFRFVKTHMLPGELLPDDATIPAIYLVRDGRDAILSIAHHRKDIVKPGSDFNANLLEAIVAEEGSFFGGWSRNAAEWIERADLIIRYEDLVANPLAVFERVNKLIHLPKPNWNNLPSFEEMKSGKAMYGGTSKVAKKPNFNIEDFAGKFFRKGKSGGWKEEMTPEVQDLFWNHHGSMMERLGYETYKNSIGQNITLDYVVMRKMGLAVPPATKKKFNVYLEATKVIEEANDGVRRYIDQLIKRFIEVTKNGEPIWEFKLFIDSKPFSLQNYKVELKGKESELFHPYEKVLMGFKSSVRSFLPGFIYNSISFVYKKSGIRSLLSSIRQIATIDRMKAEYKKNVDEKKSIHLIHIPLPQNSIYFKNIDDSYLVTVHDLTHKLFPQYHESTNISLAEAGMKFIAEKKAEVIAVSKNTIKDLLVTDSIPSEKIHLVYEAPDQDIFKWNINKILAAKIRGRYKLGEDPYFLCLSTIEPRKNLPNTIKAFNRFTEENPSAKINLVIAGNFGWKTEHLSDELHLNNPRIIFTGFVNDEDLPVVYSEAIALCYVSFYEGFGLPPLEAMSCRTPVIYGDNSSMKEVISDAGLPADPNDISSIKSQMHRIFSDPELRNNLAIRSHHRSFEFSWRRSIYDTLKVYEKLVQR